MIKISHTAQVASSPIAVEVVGDFVFVLDSNHRFYKFRKDTLQKTDYHALQAAQPLHNFEKSAAISSQGQLAIFVQNPNDAKDRGCAVYLACDELTPLKKLGSASAACAFSKDGKYLAVGSQSGEVKLYSSKNLLLLFRVPPKGDSVSSVCFSQGGRFLAVASFSGVTVVIDLDRYVQVADFLTSSPIETMQFDTEQTLSFACRSSSAGYFDIKNEALSIAGDIECWPTNSVVLNNKKYAAIACRADKLTIIKTYDAQQILQIPLTNASGIASLAVCGDALFLGFTDGQLWRVDMMYGYDEFITFIKIKKYTEAADVTRKNIFLSLQSVWEESLARDWPDVERQVADMLAKNNIAAATQLAQPFLGDKERRVSFEMMLLQKNDVAELYALVEKKEYAKAYIICEKYINLSKTHIYTQLEDAWLKILLQCRKLMEQDPENNKNKALELLRPFISTQTKKRTIVEFFKNVSKYAESEDAVRKKDFAKYFKLVEQYEFLKDTALYPKVVELGRVQIDKIAACIQDGNFEQAMACANILVCFEPFAKAAALKKEEIADQDAFVQAVSSQNFVHAFDLIEKNPAVCATREYMSLTAQISQQFDRAQLFAAKGLTTQAYTVLKPIYDVHYFESKVLYIIRVSLLTYIVSQERDKQSAGRLFAAFVKFFGLDDDAVRIAKKFALDTKSNANVCDMPAKNALKRLKELDFELEREM